MENPKQKVLNQEQTLFLLKELEQNPKVNQRDLAQKLEISLGKINFLINALVAKGVIEVKNFKNSKNKLSYMYLLTPEGIKTKLELTRSFFEWKIQEYEKLKKEIEEFKKEIPAKE
jgi:EPS-associated MarR family transcriptional regulator